MKTTLSLTDKAIMLMFLDGKKNKVYGKKGELGLKIERRPQDVTQFILAHEFMKGSKQVKEAIAKRNSRYRVTFKETGKLTQFGKACDKFLLRYGKKLNVSMSLESIKTL